MKNIITEPGETRHFILELLAEACQKVWASPTDYKTLDERLGAYNRYCSSWLIITINFVFALCFASSFLSMFFGGIKYIDPQQVLTVLISATVLICTWRQEKKLYSRVNWEQLNFFREVEKLLESLYDTNALIMIDSGEDLQVLIANDTLEAARTVQRKKIENPEAHERVRLKSLVNLIVRLGWMNTDKAPVFYDGSDEKVIWRARADWLYGELFKQA